MTLIVASSEFSTKIGARTENGAEAAGVAGAADEAAAAGAAAEGAVEADEAVAGAADGLAGGGSDITLVKRVPAGKTPSHLAIDTRSTVVYASLQDSDQLIAVDLATQTPRWTVPSGKMPADVYLTPDDRTLLVGLTGDSVVEAYDVSVSPPKLIRRIPTGDGAHAFRAWGDRRHVLVSNRVANTISRIDLQTLAVVDTYPAPSGPDCMDLSPDRRFIFVASRWAGKLTVIDTEQKKVVRQVSVGKSPHGVWTLDHAPRL